MTEGKWTCSTDEEHWNCDQEFDTREEALAYAIAEHGPDYGIEDGQLVWTGQIRAVTMEQMAPEIIDADEILDRMASWLYDNVGEDFADEITMSKDQGYDLDRRLSETIIAWAKEHGIKPGCFRLEHTESHCWSQCGEKRVIDTDPSSEPPHTERCLRHIDHDGDCEWP